MPGSAEQPTGFSQTPPAQSSTFLPTFFILNELIFSFQPKQINPTNRTSLTSNMVVWGTVGSCSQDTFHGNGEDSFRRLRCWKPWVAQSSLLDILSRGKKATRSSCESPAEELSRVLLLVSGGSFPEAEVREIQSCALGCREMCSKTSSQTQRDVSFFWLLGTPYTFTYKNIFHLARDNLRGLSACLSWGETCSLVEWDT